MTELEESTVLLVNFTKLTNSEKKTLVALLERRLEEFHFYPSEGNDQAGIAFMLYGDRARSPYSGQGDTLRYSIKTMMSRALNALWKKGLVYKCRPVYQYGGRYRWRYLKSLDVYSWKEYIEPYRGEQLIGPYYEGTIETDSPDNLSKDAFRNLPDCTKVWWILTDEGKRIANKEGQK